MFNKHLKFPQRLPEHLQCVMRCEKSSFTLTCAVNDVQMKSCSCLWRIRVEHGHKMMLLSTICCELCLQLLLPILKLDTNFGFHFKALELDCGGGTRLHRPDTSTDSELLESLRSSWRPCRNIPGTWFSLSPLQTAYVMSSQDASESF